MGSHLICPHAVDLLWLILRGALFPLDLADWSTFHIYTPFNLRIIHSPPNFAGYRFLLNLGTIHTLPSSTHFKENPPSSRFGNRPSPLPIRRVWNKRGVVAAASHGFSKVIVSTQLASAPLQVDLLIDALRTFNTHLMLSLPEISLFLQQCCYHTMHIESYQTITRCAWFTADDNQNEMILIWNWEFHDQSFSN